MSGYCKAIIFLTCTLFVNVAKANTIAVEILPSYHALTLTEQGRFKVSEQGDLVGATFVISSQIARALTIAGTVNRAKGVADYKGYTQLGSSLVTSTDFTLQSWQADALWHINDQVALVAGLNNTQWLREIRPTQNVRGIKERYQWQETSLGLRIKWPFSEVQSLKFRVEALQVGSAQLEFDYPNYVNNPVTLKGMTGSGYEVGVRYERCVDANCWSVGAMHHQLELKASDLKNIKLNSKALALVEPATHWSMQSIAVGWHYDCEIM